MTDKYLKRVFWWVMGLVVIPLALVGVLAVLFAIYAVFIAAPVVDEPRPVDGYRNHLGRAGLPDRPQSRRGGREGDLGRRDGPRAEAMTGAEESDTAKAPSVLREQVITYLCRAGHSNQNQIVPALL